MNIMVESFQAKQMTRKSSLKTGAFLMLALSLVTLYGCKKNGNDLSEDILTSKIWKRGLSDSSPSNNPPGKITYYAVKECEKDDTFKFGSQGKLTLNRGTSQCDPDEEEEEVLNYSMNENAKKITIGGTTYTLLEESKNQIKYYKTLSSGTGYEYIIYLLQ